MSETKSALEGKRFTDQPTLGTGLRGDEILLLHNPTGVKQVGTGDFLGQLAYDQIETPYGRDLTVLFADEIAKFSDPWAWIQDRITKDKISDLKVNDYITIKTTEGLSFDMQIMGRAYSEHYGDTEIGKHLDFCSRQVYPTNHVWNTANNNNGNADHHNPFLASELKAWMDASLYPTLPANVRNVIVPKRLYTPGRYSASGPLTDDNEYMWNTFEKLWLPTEKEIIGCTNHGTMHYHEGEFQYPYFAYAENRNKLDTNGARHPWWVATAFSGNTTRALIVYAYGDVGHDYTSDTWLSVPLCFRIGAKS